MTEFEPTIKHCLDILSEGMWQFKDLGPDSEQFEVIPEPPKLWREWRKDADLINFEIRMLVERIRQLKGAP